MAKTKCTTRKEGERREGVRRSKARVGAEQFLARRWGSLVAALVRGFKQSFCRALREHQVWTAQLNAFRATSLPWRIPCRYSSVFDILPWMHICFGPPPHQSRPGNNSVRQHFSECFAAACNLQSLPTYRYRLTCACFPLSSFFSWRWNVTLLLLFCG